MNTWRRRFFIAAGFLVVPAIAVAAGGHDVLTCGGCHSLHAAKSGEFILAVEANTKDLNPRTKQPYGGTTGLCLACHQSQEKGGHGMTPISGNISHPYGLSAINPKIARVPNELTRKGRFECSSCHDPHPSNTNYKYLRVDTDKGSAMENFCAVCHPSKADPKVSNARGRFFDSMDERVNRDQVREQKQAATQTAEKKKQR